MIYLDTCLLVYAVEGHAALDAGLRARLQERHGSLAISALVKLECLTGPMRRGDTALRLRFEGAFSRLVLLDMPEPVYLAAAELRARFGLKTPDALHLATAQFHGCEALWTNDARLERAGRGLALDVLEGGGR